MSIPFDSDWVVAPGETLDDWFDEAQLFTVHARACHAQRFGIRATRLDGFLAGGPLDDELAVRLALMTGIPRVFWAALEHNFRVGLAAGKTWSRA